MKKAIIIFLVFSALLLSCNNNSRNSGSKSETDSTAQIADSSVNQRNEIPIRTPGEIIDEGASPTQTKKKSPTEILCYLCDGNGKCPTCNGTRQTSSDNVCPECGGDGKCSRCDGTGFER